MEHESLEDLKGAAITNKDYINVINIKIDREEHPDGQVYMSPIKLMIDSSG